MTPPDSHVHTQWSWDAPLGSMEGACARAVELGLPSLAFTDHADFGAWLLPPGVAELLAPHEREYINPAGSLVPPALDLAGYLDSVRRCREQFPQLRILSGVELGEPHWYPDEVAALLGAGDFDRVLGSVHSARVPAGTLMIQDLYGDRPVGDVVREYLAEVLRLVESPAPFAVLAHIDYPVRYWPRDAEPFRPAAFAEEFRVVLRALATSGRALEVNTRLPLDPQVVRWWYEAGGSAVSFGSDAHVPVAVADGFADAAVMVESCGFRAPSGPADPHAFWTR